MIPINDTWKERQLVNEQRFGKKEEIAVKRKIMSKQQRWAFLWG